MRTVGLDVLKNKLSEYVRMASRRETILITDLDVVVAQLVPPKQEREGSTPDPMLADAIREGLFAPALGTLGVASTT